MHFEAILIKLAAKRADLTEAYSEALLNEETVSQKKKIIDLRTLCYRCLSDSRGSC